MIKDGALSRPVLGASSLTVSSLRRVTGVTGSLTNRNSTLNSPFPRPAGYEPQDTHGRSAANSLDGSRAMPTGGHSYSRTETKERSKSLHAPSWVPGEKMDRVRRVGGARISRYISRQARTPRGGTRTTSGPGRGTGITSGSAAARPRRRRRGSSRERERAVSHGQERYLMGS